MKNQGILLIDDDAMMNFIQKRIVSRYFPESSISVFEKATDAIAEITKHPAMSYLVFLDLNMPQMNGWEFIKHLEQNNFIDGLTLVILTSSIDQQDQNDAFNYKNVLQFISKPLTKEKIESILELEDVKQFL